MTILNPTFSHSSLGHTGKLVWVRKDQLAWGFVFPARERQNKYMFKQSETSKKQMEWIKKHKILSTLVGASLVLLTLAVLNSGGSSSTSNPVVQNKPSEMTVGQEGFLRLPGISDPSKVICLGSTKEEASQITKSLLAKDYLGILEIPGAFCVGNGSRALLVEKGFTLSKVRIIEGVNDVDSDKVGHSGWLPFEWVVSQ